MGKGKKVAEIVRTQTGYEVSKWVLMVGQEKQDGIEDICGKAALLEFFVLNVVPGIRMEEVGGLGRKCFVIGDAEGDMQEKFLSFLEVIGEKI